MEINKLKTAEELKKENDDIRNENTDIRNENEKITKYITKYINKDIDRDLKVIEDRVRTPENLFDSRSLPKHDTPRIAKYDRLSSPLERPWGG